MMGTTALNDLFQAIADVPAGNPSPLPGGWQWRMVMLYWALVFLIIAIIAAFFGFGGVAVAAAGIAKILFFVFLVIFVVALVTGLMARRGPPV